MYKLKICAEQINGKSQNTLKNNLVWRAGSGGRVLNSWQLRRDTHGFRCFANASISPASFFYSYRVVRFRIVHRRVTNARRESCVFSLQKCGGGGPGWLFLYSVRKTLHEWNQRPNETESQMAMLSMKFYWEPISVTYPASNFFYVTARRLVCRKLAAWPLADFGLQFFRQIFWFLDFY